MATRAQSLTTGLKRMKAGLNITPCQQMAVQRYQWRTEGKMRKALIYNAPVKAVQSSPAVVIPLRKTFGQRMAALAATVLSVFKSSKGGR